MNVADTVRDAIWRYPSVIKTKGDVLHHLFFVIGNGYDWVDGELVHWQPIPREDEDAYFDDRGLEVLSNTKATWDAEVDLVRSEIDQRVLNPQMSVRSVYPASSFSHIANLPDDITDDWLDAATDALIEAERGYRKRHFDGWKTFSDEIKERYAEEGINLCRDGAKRILKLKRERSKK